MGKAVKVLLKVFGLSVLSGILIVAIGLVVLNIIWGCQIKDEMAAIKAKGEPASAADLDRWSIPDDQNGSVVYQQIFKQTSAPAVSGDLGTLRKFVTAKEGERTPDLRKQARGALDRCGRLIPLLEQAASRPKCRFRVDHLALAGGSGFTTFGKLRGLAFIPCARAILSAEDGKADEAVKSLRLSFRIGESLKDEPMLVPQLVRIAITLNSCSALRCVLDHGGINEDQARSLGDAMGTIELNSGAALAWAGERALFMTFVPLMAKGDVRFTRDMLMTESDTGDAGATPFFVHAYALVFGRGDEAAYLRAMGKLLNSADVPYRDAVYRDRINGSREEREQVFGIPPYALVTRILFPVFLRFGAKKDIASATAIGCRTELALLAYKDRYGVYPASLGELRAKLGWKLREDPFSGKDFIYKRQGKGFLLYSIGPNLKDDGGVEPPKKDSHNRDKGDIVWRMER